jgi:hypothetical protein
LSSIIRNDQLPSKDELLEELKNTEVDKLNLFTAKINKINNTIDQQIARLQGLKNDYSDILNTANVKSTNKNYYQFKTNCNIIWDPKYNIIQNDDTFNYSIDIESVSKNKVVNINENIIQLHLKCKFPNENSQCFITIDFDKNQPSNGTITGKYSI